MPAVDRSPPVIPEHPYLRPGCTWAGRCSWHWALCLLIVASHARESGPAPLLLSGLRPCSPPAATQALPSPQPGRLSLRLRSGGCSGKGFPAPCSLPTTLALQSSPHCLPFASIPGRSSMNGNFVPLYQPVRGDLALNTVPSRSGNKNQSHLSRTSST